MVPEPHVNDPRAVKLRQVSRLAQLIQAEHGAQMSVCLLQDFEVGRLIHYGLLPDHSEHSHVDAKDAFLGVKDGTFELVDTGPRQYVTRTKCYFLRRTPSGGHGGIDTVQRVLSNHILELKPVR